MFLFPYKKKAFLYAENGIGNFLKKIHCHIFLSFPDWFERTKPEKEKGQPVRLPLPEDLRREEEIIEPEGIDENWIRIGEEMPGPACWQNC